MPDSSAISPLGTFLKALNEEKIRFILIGMMAAIRQGAPLMTIDYDLWIDLPERQYVRMLAIVQGLGGTIRAGTVYELSDGTQVNAVFKPDGLKPFAAEFKSALKSQLEGQSIRVLPLARVIASKRAAGRDKDKTVLPVLERTLRLSARLNRRTKRRRRN